LGARGDSGAGFQPVLVAFEDVLGRTRGGASFTAIQDGKVVVDLHGGWADGAHTRSWDRGTAATIFSGSKGLVAMCLATLVERGALNLDAPVSSYWPEFGQAGKAKITVRELASHRAGLAAVESGYGVDLLCSPEYAAALLARQSPRPELAGAPCYHAITFGWLCGELVRRVTGDSFSHFFRRAIADRASAEVWFGMPPTALARAADAFGADDFVAPGSMAESEYGRRVFAVAPDLWSGPDLLFNQPRVRRAEIPAVGAIGTARGVARCYAAFAGGSEARPPLVSADVLRVFTTPQFDQVADPFLGEQLRLGIGFELQTGTRLFGPPDDAFGHTGAGGSTHGWWPSQRTAFSFVINELQNEVDDFRARDVLAALYSVIAPDRSVDVTQPVSRDPKPFASRSRRNLDDGFDFDGTVEREDCDADC
jgi:CubicO group peptidase (beta-lactamase class C family)